MKSEIKKRREWANVEARFREVPGCSVWKDSSDEEGRAAVHVFGSETIRLAMGKRPSNRRIGLGAEQEEECGHKRRRLEDFLEVGSEVAPEVQAASQMLDIVAARICVPGPCAVDLRMLGDSLQKFLHKVGEPRGRIARPEHLWEGMIRDGQPLGEGMMGSVL